MRRDASTCNVRQVKIFLDIGAHMGETLEVVLDRRWRFDRIVCFEPAPNCWSTLRHLAADSRVEICPFGLWNKDDTIALHNPGHVGASIASDKDPIVNTTVCEFRDAAQWFQDNLSETDVIFAKINVEGAEVHIIDRLAERDQLAKIGHLLIHFDVRKVPSLRHLEAPARALLEEAGIEYLSADEIQYGGVIRGTKNWLRWCQGGRWRELRYKALRKRTHTVRLRLYPVKRAVLSRVHR